MQICNAVDKSHGKTPRFTLWNDIDYGTTGSPASARRHAFTNSLSRLYYALKGSDGSVKAESREGCGAYLKLFYLGKECRMEAMTDGLATISQDMLMAEEGKARGALNLFFHPGSESG